MKRIIVDKNDIIIGAKESDDINYPSEIYRVSALWVWNSKGEVLIAQRGFTDTNSPGTWGPSAAGTVEKGETYEQNVVKEADEELGLTNITATFIQKYFISGYRNYFVKVYKTVVDKPAKDFVIQKDEVAAVKWIAPTMLSKDVEDNPQNYIDNMNQCLESLK